MKYDGRLDIATGMSAKSKSWANKKTSWGDLVERLRTAVVTNETYKEFIAASKNDQSKIKDVGGYVGGYLLNGRRKPDSVSYRQLMTLDIDFAHTDLWEDFTLLFSNAAVLHATHKHCNTSPRYRLIMPLSREATPDEYVAVSRMVAGMIGIELFDNTTFETNRLMFWPSVPRDVEYYCEVQDGEWIDVDKILGSYTNWHDTSLWPTAERRLNEVKDSAKKQEDPASKKGIVGAFCRCYSITEAIEKFLPSVYSPTALDDRYTYALGTTTAGLIVYEDKWAYSHHGTDPCSGKLCNSFDLVRTHLYGHLDNEESKTDRPKSFQAMEEMARKDVEVKKIIAKESLAEAKYEFASEPDAMEDDNLDWMKDLDIDAKGNYLSSAPNINLVFMNDRRLKGLFRRNDFDSKNYVFGSLPWRRVRQPEPLRNVDAAGIRNYVESIYGISSVQKIDDALSLEFERNRYHPITEYLSSLVWDGEQRIDRLLIDYLGVADNIYTREAIRKSLIGAVARVFRPGIKFDTMLVLVGAQGTGKSTFIHKLGKNWFSDTFITAQGKDSFEQIQGVWLMEIAELAGLKKAEVETVKHFVSKQEDIFRGAYRKEIETFPRQCVFFGTTNNTEFLRDPTGNRRFLPIDIHRTRPVKSVFCELEPEVDQIWAEAVQLYRAGEPLILSAEAEKIAFDSQKSHSETDERRGIIEEYLNKRLPSNWEDMDLLDRRSFLNDPLSKQGTVFRDYVCVAEIWCECLCKDKNEMDRYKTRELNDILRSLEDWDQQNSTRNFKIYGKQKFYERKMC